MKRIFLTIVTLFTVISVFGSGTESAKKENKGKEIEVWQAKGPLGLTTPSTLDTTVDYFRTNDVAFKRTIAFQSLGNIGTASISKIFSDRIQRSNFIFFEPYSLYYTAPEDIQYYNTKVPYANISYYSGGLTNRKQQHISGIFSVNINPHFNMGMYGKWQNNYGSYDNQSTKNYNAGFFGSYIHRHHELMANISLNGYRAMENGGFYEIGQITDPKNYGKLDAYNIQTVFNNDVTSKLVNWNAYLNYKFHFGYDKTVNVTEDSTTTTFIPVSSLIYTFRNEADYKRYKEDEIGINGGMYSDSLYNKLGIGNNHYINNKTTADSLHYWEMTHTVGLSLNEEFNTIGKFGVAGYLTYTQKQYGQIDHINSYVANNSLVQENKISLNNFGADTLGRLGEEVWTTTTNTTVGLGANISKRKGEHLQFNFNGEYFFKDEKETGGTFALNADIKSKFNIGRHQFALKANASHEQYCPDYLEEHYMGNRVQWDNNFDNKKKTVLEGSVGAEKIYLYKEDSSFLAKLAPEVGLTIKANETTLNDYVYFGTKGVPEQEGSNLSITRITVNDQLKIWYLHFDNELTFQFTNARNDVLDLPALCLFSNLYLKTNPLFKVLTLQLGVDMRYNSEYYAAAYLPATGLFYAQNQEKLGGYPFYDAYLSMHLKSFRLFVQYSHINHIWSNNNNYLITPGYALEPNYLKFGVSVNFRN